MLHIHLTGELPTQTPHTAYLGEARIGHQQALQKTPNGAPPRDDRAPIRTELNARFPRRPTTALRVRPNELKTSPRGNLHTRVYSCSFTPTDTRRQARDKPVGPDGGGLPCTKRRADHGPWGSSVTLSPLLRASTCSKTVKSF